jgi:hypothetical protein
MTCSTEPLQLSWVLRILAGVAEHCGLSVVAGKCVIRARRPVSYIWQRSNLR